MELMQPTRKDITVRITIVTPIFPPEIGGPASYVPELAKRLCKDHQVTVIVFCSQKPKQYDEFKVVWVSTGGGLLIRQGQLLLKLLLQCYNSDLIYAQGTVTVGWASLVATTLMSNRLMVKFVGDELWEQSQRTNPSTPLLETYYSTHQSNKLMLWLHRQVLKQADMLVTPSVYLKKFLIRYHGVSSKKIKVIPNPVEIKVNRQNKPQKVRKQLVYIGRLVKWKRVDRVINALKQTDWRLVVVGGGPEQKNLQKMARGIAEKIVIVGRKSKADTLRILQQSQAVILLSEYEGQSHVLIEAMQLGIPIIASNISANCELLNGYATLIPIDEPEALLKALKTIKSIPAKTQHQYQEKYSWQNHLKKFQQLLDH
jgi:glycosyltransferase involved in cell wall biosynthesis